MTPADPRKREASLSFPLELITPTTTRLKADWLQNDDVLKPPKRGQSKTLRDRS